MSVCTVHEGRGLACGDQPPAAALVIHGELSEDATIHNVERRTRLVVDIDQPCRRGSLKAAIDQMGSPIAWKGSIHDDGSEDALGRVVTDVRSRGSDSLAPCWDHDPSAQFWWDLDPGTKKTGGIGRDRGKNTWIPAQIPATKDRKNTAKTP